MRIRNLNNSSKLRALLILLCKSVYANYPCVRHVEYIYVYINIFIYILYIYIYIYICVYVCVCVCVYTLYCVKYPDINIYIHAVPCIMKRTAVIIV